MHANLGVEAIELGLGSIPLADIIDKNKNLEGKSYIIEGKEFVKAEDNNNFTICSIAYKYRLRFPI